MVAVFSNRLGIVPSMFSRQPIRTKLIVGITVLMCMIGALAATSFVGVYAFRGLAKSLRLRAPELTFSSALARDVSRLVVTYQLRERTSDQPDFEFSFIDTDNFLRQQFRVELGMVQRSFKNYRDLLAENEALDEYKGIRVMADEQAAVAEFRDLLDSVRIRSSHDFWDGSDSELSAELTRMNTLATELPQFLHSRLGNFSDEVRGQYRTWIFVGATASTISAILLVAFLRLFYVWILRPLRVLVHGSRLVAAGKFDHRIKLDSQDEMTELANAMNAMTRRFQEIRDDLDEQVQQRTREVIRSEQLASVGFLAAGVAHEINNPLASIAFCAESLESRLNDIIVEDDAKPDEEHNEEVTIARDYLRTMQDEAFRCKQITERLLDFSRLGDVEKHHTDLTQLVASVISMVKHIGKYKAKEIVFNSSVAVSAPVNAQEMKQVVLNLLTNALDSLDPGGEVRVSLSADKEVAKLAVRDNGCGMTAEVQQHLFEPFYSRRRHSQGTGLGMSITYRIVKEHDGEIEVYSAGPGKGSPVTVTLPMMDHEEEANQSERIGIQGIAQERAA